MASSVQCGYALWQDGETFNGLLGRTSHIAASFWNNGPGQIAGGTMPSGGGMAVTPGSGMAVTVSTGYVLCVSSGGSAQGGYLFGLLSPATLTVATSDPTNPRVDMICANVVDPGTSAGYAEVQIIAGTPTAGANSSNLNGAPAAPSNAEVLAYLVVPAGATSIVTGDLVPWANNTVAQGGILPFWAPSGVPTGYTGMYLHDTASGRLCHNPAGTLEQPILLPFVPQRARASSAGPFTPSSGAHTVVTTTITTDGNTDIEIIVAWGSASASGSSPYSAAIDVHLDSTKIFGVSIGASNNEPGLACGGGYTYITQSGVDRPAAGTHTVSLVVTPNTGNSGNLSVGTPNIYVRPAPL